MQDIKSEVRPEVAIRVRNGGRLIPAEWSSTLASTNRAVDAILTEQPGAGAYLERHVYPDGYGRRHLDKPWWLARCDAHPDGAMILNSGHHFDEGTLDDARAWIALHNAEEHAS